LAIVACLILSLAGIQLVRRADNLAVVFLVDVSDSMSLEAIAAETEYVRQSLEGMSPEDQFAVVLFGADALVERPMLAGRDLSPFTSAPVMTQTDLAEAIRLGMALFPSGAAKRMAILSDGAQTTGDALKAAEFAAATDVQIVVVPFTALPGAEALITFVDAPSHLRRGESFDLNVTIQASQPTSAVLRVLAGDVIAYEATHDLRRGTQTFSLPLKAGEPGFIRYQVQIAPAQDGFHQNNRLDAFSLVEGPPRILVVAPAPGEIMPGGGTRPDDSAAVIQSLQAAGFTVTLITPSLLPSSLPSLAQYNAVALVDVPARQLGQNQMDALRVYVHDLGGGLVAIGGPTSFGVGGYYGTPLEEALPVEMQIKDETRRPSLAIVFIIDRSGSMSDSSGGAVKLELAKEAAARSVELLFPTDRVGVIAFDDTASWVVPMTDMSDPDSVVNAIGTIQSGGGTDIMAGLQAMAKILPGDPALVKHVVLLTDGGADPTGIPELVQKLFEENGITLSTVAVGRDAAPWLEDLAATGGGRYHFTADPSAIPSIFTEETTLASRAYIVEETFFPTQVSASPILSNIESLPALYGYVAASPKNLARVILESPKHDPILAAWQYGLGRAVAFTSDATGRWARDWVTWPGFPTFWAQAVRYTLGSTQNASLELSVANEGEAARLLLDTINRNGTYLNGMKIEANIVGPNGEIESVVFRQIAPGRYETSFHPTAQGVYLIRINGQGADGSFSQTAGWTMTYSPEYARIESDPDLLLRLAALANGTVGSADPTDIFDHNLNASRAARPIWPWLVALAALLLPFDIASRRLILTRQDFLRLRANLANWRSSRRAPELQTSPHMTALFQAKQRAQSNAPVEPLRPIIPEEPAEPPTEPPPAPDKAPTQDPSQPTAQALLARKRMKKK
jgi:Mg-chelatase subunit ChlD